MNIEQTISSIKQFNLEFKKALEQHLPLPADIPAIKIPADLSAFNEEDKTQLTIYKALKFVYNTREQDTINHIQYGFLAAEYEALGFGNPDDYKESFGIPEENEMLRAAKAFAEIYIDIAYIKCNGSPHGMLYNIQSIEAEDTKKAYIGKYNKFLHHDYIYPEGAFMQIGDDVDKRGSYLKNFLEILPNHAFSKMVPDILKPTPPEEIKQDIKKAAELGKECFDRGFELFWLQDGIKTQGKDFIYNSHLNLDNFELKIEEFVDQTLNDILLPAKGGEYSAEEKRIAANFIRKHEPELTEIGTRSFCDEIVKEALNILQNKALLTPQEQRIVDMAQGFDKYLEEKGPQFIATEGPKKRMISPENYSERVEAINEQLEHNNELKKRLAEQKGKPEERAKKIVDILSKENPEKAKHTLGVWQNRALNEKSYDIYRKAIEDLEKEPKYINFKPFIIGGVVLLIGSAITGSILGSAYLTDKFLPPQKFSPGDFMFSITLDRIKNSSTFICAHQLETCIIGGALSLVVAAIVTILLVQEEGLYR